MTTFFVALGFFGVFIALMATGVIFSNKRIAGSCGGLNKVTYNEAGDKICGVCGIPAEQMAAKYRNVDEPVLSAELDKLRIKNKNDNIGVF